MNINKLMEHKTGKHNDLRGSPQTRGYVHQTAYNSFNLFNKGYKLQFQYCIIFYNISHREQKKISDKNLTERPLLSGPSIYPNF